MLAGSRATIARAITLVESARPDHREAAQQLLMELLEHAGGAHRVGISGVCCRRVIRVDMTLRRRHVFKIL